MMIIIGLLCFLMISTNSLVRADSFTSTVSALSLESPGVQLTDNPYGGASDPDWSPYGSKVVFYQFDSTQWNRHIWTIDVATRVATQLTFGSVVHGFPQYSPDGSRIIFSWWGFRGDYNDFAIVNADGSGLQSIPYNPPDYPVSGIDYIHPEFSPDGAKIAFHYGVGTTWGHSTAYVATMAFDATTLRLSQLNLLATGGQPRWSPDGAQIIYHTGYISPSADPSQIMIMDASGSNVRAVTNGPYDYTPDMAVDGNIVFSRCNSAVAERGGRVESNLYLMRRIGEEPVQLTFDSGVFNWLPVFSPDGTKIAYMSDRSGSTQIWVMELAKGPKASFTVAPETANVGQAITFDASASTSGWNGTHEMPISGYRWDFADGNQTTTSTPVVYHKFNSPGVYYVTLTVYAPGATPETDTASHKVTIISVPVGGYSIPTQEYTTTQPLTPYSAMIAMLTIGFIAIKRKTTRKRK